jgi:hypothetical protein
MLPPQLLDPDAVDEQRSQLIHPVSLNQISWMSLFLEVKLN